MVAPIGIVLSNSFMQEMLNLKIAHMLAEWDITIGLFKDTSTLTDCASTIANIVEADFDGYSQLPAITWGTASAVGGCVWRSLDDPVTWVPTGTTHPNSIGGYFILDTVGPTLKFWEWFSVAGVPTSKTVGATLIPLTINPRLDEKRIV